MPETDTIPVSASVASTGKGIRYIGDYAYAYSGAFNSTGTTETDYLDFISGSGFIDAIFEFMYDETTNLDIKFNIYLNEISVVAFIIGNAGSAGTGLQPSDVRLIIPPNSRVRTTCQGSTSGFVSNMVGRVYGVK